jgi:hypothetical protein
VKFDGLHAALENAAYQCHDLPAAIRSRSRSSSSGVQRTLGTTQSFLALQPDLNQAADGFGPRWKWLFLFCNPVVQLGQHRRRFANEIEDGGGRLARHSCGCL